MTVLLRGWLLAGCLGVLAAGQSFPTTQVETLAGGKLSIPQAFGGKPAILVWSFSKKAGEATRAWTDPLAKEGLPVWSAAMLEAAPRFVRPMIRGGMRKDMPEAQQQHALLFYQGEKQWRQILKPPKDDDPLVVLLDAQGNVAWSYSGVYAAKTIDEVRQRFKSLAK
ncbi:hypothetical protein [Paludibaculum fermentans]|uniref:Uncharacterized protein n=1 Tax=Paludibaculum fermentans TaxID=1473598 RepID=A0A7S7NLZ7_PALFE|nr:hypothetical protein [Paludibaculum fermentans]QOY85574.1 hypothetical protein IRI77_22435 [Paludibaculum fermentans]